jgi:2-oxoisovalerate dehydrogenase E1 component alpha subunit
MLRRIVGSSRRFVTKEKAQFPGAKDSVFTADLKFIKDYPSISTYRVIDTQGKLIDKAQDPNVY